MTMFLVHNGVRNTGDSPRRMHASVRFVLSRVRSLNKIIGITKNIFVEDQVPILCRASVVFFPSASKA
jgi:hypothetical protein